MPAGSGERWAVDYERGRPGWPAEVVDLPGLPREATVLELGAGTGKLTRLLVQTFARVVAVEPAEPMRNLLASDYPRAEAVAGTAEDIPLPDSAVDAVFTAEAFHRFDAERTLGEIARVLRPGGAVVLMWNLPASPWEPSIAAAEAVARELLPRDVALGYDPFDLGAARYTSGQWRQPFVESPFAPLQELTLPNPQTVDREGVVAFLASMGWIADLADDVRLPLLATLKSRLPDVEYRRLWETHVYSTRLEVPDVEA